MATFEILIVCDPEKGEVQVRGPLEAKGPMINALATAIQIVANHQSPSIVPEILTSTDAKAAN